MPAEHSALESQLISDDHDDDDDDDADDGDDDEGEAGWPRSIMVTSSARLSHVASSLVGAYRRGGRGRLRSPGGRWRQSWGLN